MQSNNPVFHRTQAFSGGGYARSQQPPAPSAEELERMYDAPSAVRTARLTYDEVVTKTGITFGVLLVGAAIGWWMPGLAMVGLIVGLVLGLVNAFKREPSPALILAYAGFEGLFVGGISNIFENMVLGGQPLNGIVAQAILGTLGVFVAALWAYRSRRIRVTPKFQRGVLIALGGYMAFVVVNFMAQMFGWADGTFGFRSGFWGIAIGLFAITLAALVLILDFDFIEKGVQQGIPAKYAWTAAFGLTVTLVWLYVEMLRLLAIIRGE